MEDKDKSEKLFLACKDVFEEIVNVLLYGGKHEITEDELIMAPTESIYFGSDKKQHSQFRDFGMYRQRKGVILGLYGIENQSHKDKRMPLRLSGYNGAAYRSQYKSKENQPVYPVITLVLNWGKYKWNKPNSLRDLLKNKLPKQLDKYVDNSIIPVFDMRYLDKSVREKFQGDMRIILDYFNDEDSFRQRYQNANNPYEVNMMLYALTGDERYLNYADLEKGENMGRCKVLDRILDEGRELGREEGREQGISALIARLKSLGLSYEETANSIKEDFGISDDRVQQSMNLYWG